MSKQVGAQYAVSSASLDALRQIQRELYTKSEDSIPDGWKTVANWADESGLSRCHVYEILERAVKAGTMERKPYRIVCGQVGVRRVPHYKKINGGR